MASSVIRGRIAPVALLIALAFVIVGFFRADREIARAEYDRAELTVSEMTSSVDAFILRRLDELETVVQAADSPIQDSTALAENLLIALARHSALRAHLHQLWLVDTTLRVKTVVSLGGTGDSTPFDPMALSQLVERTRMSPLVLFEPKRHHALVLVVPVSGRYESRVIALVSVDSLMKTLRRNRSSTLFDVVVTTPSDTVLTIRNALPKDGTTHLARSISLPGGDQWTVGISYAPSGRGVRIGLWVVGLTAIIGLGIGLILERREATRIADRSTELEHLSAELLRANRAKSEFLANVSHELRTPLNAIVGFVDLLRDGVYGPLNPRQAGPVERIEASANHLRHLVDQVLDLAKMAAGRLEVHTEPIELRPFVFDVASEVEPLMTEKGLNFSLAVGASLPRVRTDPTHLRQILVNLLGNAAKFTSSGGISIRGKLVQRTDPKTTANDRPYQVDLVGSVVKPEALWIALQVADSGIGIAERDRERIFDEFEQVNAGPRGDSMRRGTGLGLSISRRLARLLGGDITVESELGRGSVFTVWLPVDPAETGNRNSNV